MLKYLDDLRKKWREFFLREIPLTQKTKNIFWGVLFIIAIFLILTIDFIPNTIDLRVGQVSNIDVKAPRTVTFIDEEKTGELRDIATQSVRRVYEEDVSVNSKVNEGIKSFFSDIKIANRELELQKNQEHQEQEEIEDGIGESDELSNVIFNKEQVVRNLEKKYSGISNETIITLIEAPDDINDQMEFEAIRISDNIYQKRFTPEELQNIKNEVAQEAMSLNFSREYRLALANILENIVKPNMIFDEEATERNREEAREEVSPVTFTVRRDEIIIRSGDVVTTDDIKVLEALGLRKKQVNYLSIIGVFIVIIILILLASVYLIKYKKDIWNNPVILVFLEVMVLIIMVLAKIIDIIPVVNYFYLPYLVPVAMASILITVLISTDIAVITTVFISFLIALVFNNDYSVALLGFVSGLVGIFSVSRLSQRNDLVRAGFNVSGVLIFLVTGVGLINPIGSWFNILGHISMAIANGVIVAIFANGLLPYLENLFGLTSSVKLLELSNPSHPLLSKMVFEVPGTYNHCLVVANLAETAANNIGADSLLARVGSYYHDIGKMKRPYFFIENHMGRENPHDKLSPNLSALIIKTHIKEGVELGREYKLPSQIIDIIQQHHGTNLISYFYQEALEDSKYDTIEESDFRYDGPKPQSKESAIIMLADIAEAAVRSKNFSKTNHNRIEGLVRDLIKGKLIDGQLDESELSLGDLDIITDSFVKVLSGIYHQRIDYPENILKEMKRADKSDKDSSK